jgi:hypothetical protein
MQMAGEKQVKKSEPAAESYPIIVRSYEAVADLDDRTTAHLHGTAAPPQAKQFGAVDEDPRSEGRGTRASRAVEPRGAGLLPTTLPRSNSSSRNSICRARSG